jgi:hypothetical protein
MWLIISSIIIVAMTSQWTDNGWWSNDNEGQTDRRSRHENWPDDPMGQLDNGQYCVVIVIGYCIVGIVIIVLLLLLLVCGPNY